MSSAEAARWWQNLTPLQQMQAIQADPSLGNVNGVSGWARDLTNRARLAKARAYLLSERDEVLAEERAAGPYNPYTGNSMRTVVGPAAKIHDINIQLRALEAIETTLGRGNRQLLLLDAKSGAQVRTAVAVGDIDTADNISVFTPGLASNVRDSLEGYDKHMFEMQRRSATEAVRQHLPNSSTAMVTWQGYDAPQWGDTLSANSVASAHSAKEGGASLASFYEGIDRSRPDGVNLVALGHSYGSVTTGYALHHKNTGVDYAAVFGSPGIAVNNIDHLKIPKGHFYAEEAKWDGVGDLGRFGADPSHMPDVTMLSTDANKTHHTSENTWHTAYLDDKTTSQFNLSMVSLGHPELAVKDDQQPTEHAPIDVLLSPGATDGLL